MPPPCWRAPGDCRVTSLPRNPEDRRAIGLLRFVERKRERKKRGDAPLEKQCMWCRCDTVYLYSPGVCKTLQTLHLQNVANLYKTLPTLHLWSATFTDTASTQRYQIQDHHEHSARGYPESWTFCHEHSAQGYPESWTFCLMLCHEHSARGYPESWTFCLMLLPHAYLSYNNSPNIRTNPMVGFFSRGGNIMLHLWSATFTATASTSSDTRWTFCWSRTFCLMLLPHAYLSYNNSPNIRINPMVGFYSRGGNITSLNTALVFLAVLSKI